MDSQEGYQESKESKEESRMNAVDSPWSEE